MYAPIASIQSDGLGTEFFVEYCSNPHSHGIIWGIVPYLSGATDQNNERYSQGSLCPRSDSCNDIQSINHSNI